MGYTAGPPSVKAGADRESGRASRGAVTSRP
jgi:hypothetical protein